MDSPLQLRNVHLDSASRACAAFQAAARLQAGRSPHLRTRVWLHHGAMCLWIKGLSMCGAEGRARFLHPQAPISRITHPWQEVATMAARRTNAFEQKLIDHEVRMSNTREAGERHAA